MSDGDGGTFVLDAKGAQSLKTALSRVVGTPNFNDADRELAVFAHMLETQQKSPAAAEAILDVTESLAQQHFAKTPQSK